jgi:hypothetical protein
MFFIKKFILERTKDSSLFVLYRFYKTKYNLLLNKAYDFSDKQHTIIKAVINNNLVQKNFMLVMDYIYYFFKKSNIL